jgi:putative acetyltransferase
MVAIRLERALAETAEIRGLIGALDAELGANYTPEQRHGISLQALFQPPVRFFVAHVGDCAQGCGGVALFDDFAELKRMYVREEARGGGVADALIKRLIQEAAEAGLTLLRLETGTAQDRAMRFYRRHGFVDCAAFEPYAAMPAAAIATSVFMEKRI